MNGSEGASMRREDASMRIVHIPGFRTATNVMECEGRVEDISQATHSRNV